VADEVEGAGRVAARLGADLLRGARLLLREGRQEVLRQARQREIG
jgi:hypothetical protein